LKSRELEAVRTNATDRPDNGDLIKRQALVQNFDWFPQVATLRKLRTAHPSPAGSRNPIQIEDEDRSYARSLLADVVQGWIESMAQFPPTKSAV
jgi:hypothetical protein